MTAYTLADLGAVQAARGYIVAARHRDKCDLKRGDIVTDMMMDFDNLRPLGQPVRVISETDRADFIEQERLLGIPTEWPKDNEYTRFYRVQSD